MVVGAFRSESGDQLHKVHARLHKEMLSQAPLLRATKLLIVLYQLCPHF